MLLFIKQTDLVSHLNSISKETTSIGFVPTMGALHQGHLSLLREAVQHNEIVVMSIFVNPTQFNNAEDLAKYPRTLEKDMDKIKCVSDTIIVFAPSVDDIYNGKTVSQHFDFDGIENLMEGKFRAGHFDGVGTIVKRLFEIVKPTNAILAKKIFSNCKLSKRWLKKQKCLSKLLGIQFIESPMD